MNRCKYREIGWIIIGTILYAFGISVFLDPNEIAPGGFIGISVILSHTIGLYTGTWYLLLNIPVILLGRRAFGNKFIVKTAFVIILNSMLTNMFGKIDAITDDLFLASVAGSLLIGTGLGFILKTGATTGGVDIIIRFIRIKHPELKISTLFVIIDTIIVTVSGIVFKDFNIAMFAFITAVLNGRVMDYILYGSDEARLVYIISDVPEKVLKRVLSEMEAGATLLSGQGAYSNKNKKIIMCVVKKRKSILLQTIVKEEDKNAFIIITSANEIYGEGYKNIDQTGK